jgi:hypothetical protein
MSAQDMLLSFRVVVFVLMSDSRDVILNDPSIYGWTAEQLSGYPACVVSYRKLEAVERSYVD